MSTLKYEILFEYSFKFEYRDSVFFKLICVTEHARTTDVGQILLTIMYTVEINQTARHKHRCLSFEMLVKTRTNNVSQKSVVVECVMKPTIYCQSSPYEAWYNRRLKNH